MRKLLIYSSVATLAIGGVLACNASAAAQDRKPTATTSASTASGVPVPADFVIGPEDVIGVLFWREQDMSGDLAVRPDGMITLPLVGDIRATGFRPDELKEQIEKAAARFLTEPNVTVVVRQINSRKVFITGEVTTPGAYSLTSPRTVMQIIALAGGLTEWADANNITIMRMENGRQRSFKFHYRDVARGKALAQNILLQAGDTVVVP